MPLNALPAATDYTAATNQAGKKTFMTSVRAFLADMLGTAGHGFDGALLAAPRRVTFAGTADAITSTLAPAPTAYVTGMRVTGLLPGANTVTNPTLNLNAIGAKTIKKRSGTGAKVALVIGDYNGTLPFELEYDGTDMILLNPLVPARADIASAGTLDLSTTSGNLQVTGTTTTTGVTLASGQTRFVTAAGAWPLTHGASLILPGSASYTCAAGDGLLFIGEPSGVVRVMIWKANGTPVAGGGLTLGTMQTWSSGASQDYTGIPATAKQITVSYSGISTTGSSIIIVQIGDSGGVETTGYNGTTTNGATRTNWTNGIYLEVNAGSAAYSRRGSIILTLMDASTNLWSVSGGTSLDMSGSGSCVVAGDKALTATLDRVRITTVGGSDTGDGGSWNIAYQ